MKTHQTHRLSPRSPHCRAGLALTLLLTALTGLAAPLGTDFTYQGHLDGPTGPASGHYDLSFALHLASTGGTPVAAVTNYNVGVSNGLFTTAIDFGAGFFNGNAYWLQLGVRTNGTVAFTPLTPRQALTPTPNALYATLAATVPGGSITASQLAANSVGTAALQPNSVVSNKIANAQVVRSLNGLQDLVTLAAGTNTTLATNGNTLTLAGSSDWRLVGNASTTPGVNFVGTTDNQPLEFKVSNQRGLRLEPTASTDTVNVIAGSARNVVTPNVVGATIGGGGAGNVAGLAYTNRVGANFGTVSGGGQNTIQTNAAFATLGGGARNTIQTNATYATLGGGDLNVIRKDASYATLGGGTLNEIGLGAPWATIGGGSANSIGQDSSYTTIGGGSLNTIQRASSHTTIGGGNGNRIQDSITYATIGGGYLNVVQNVADAATIGGGSQNTIQTTARYATIGGGDRNTNQANAVSATIGGGGQNTVLAFANYATIPGGQLNSAGNYAFAAGRRAKATHAGSFVWADSTDADFASTAAKQFLIRAGGNVGINKNNPATALDVNGTVTATSFSGSGAGLGGLSASQLTIGTLADARLSANVSLLGASIESLEITDGTIVNADLNAAAGIADTKLATLSTVGKVANSATTATSANTANTIVARDAAGNFSAGTVTATSFGGNGGGLAGVNALTLGGLTGADFWKPTGNAGTTPGTHFLGTTDNQPLEFKVNNQRGLRLEYATNEFYYSVNVIGGSAHNSVGAGVIGATIGGGGSSHFPTASHYPNRVEADFSTVSGGFENTIQTNASHAAIGGGAKNTIQTNAAFATIGGGQLNEIQTNAWFATIGGGMENTIQSIAEFATIGGGGLNKIQALAQCATIGGGANNTIQTNATYATIPGGWRNSATNFAFAAGTGAKANHTGAFVWADSTGGDFASTAANQFSIRAHGGVRLSDETPHLSFGSQTRQMLNLWSTNYGIGVQSYTTYFRTDVDGGFAWFQGGAHNDGQTNAGGGLLVMRLDLAGNLFTTGAINPTSDRNAKENFVPVQARAVLEKVVALPLSSWNYKADTTTRHVGPMAQDFHAAFAVGTDDKHIATVDADGVALAAIQGLNQKLTEELTRRDVENVELKARLKRLEQLLNARNGGGK